MIIHNVNLMFILHINGNLTIKDLKYFMINGLFVNISFHNYNLDMYIFNVQFYMLMGICEYLNRVILYLRLLNFLDETHI